MVPFFGDYDADDAWAALVPILAKMHTSADLAAHTVIRAHVCDLAADTGRMCCCHLLGHFGQNTVVATICASSR